MKFNLLLIVVSICLIVFGVYNIFLNNNHTMIEDDLFLIIVSMLILFIFFMLGRRKNYSYYITLNSLQFPNFEKLVENLKVKYDYELDYDTIGDHYVYLYLDQLRVTCSLVDATIPKDVLREANLYALGEFDKKAVMNHDSYLYVSILKKSHFKEKEIETLLCRMTSEILSLTNSIGVYSSKSYVLKSERHNLFLKDYFITKVNNNEYEKLK